MEPMDDSSDNSNHTWLQDGFNSMQLKRSQMNELVMDYLVHEGFKEAAQRFCEEAGIEPTFSLKNKIETPEMMDRRIEVRGYIEEGDILKGKSYLNLYYPELLDNHRDIYFKLQQQHLIELIRQQKINEVLTYVHNQISVDDFRNLNEMERTLALLAYDYPEQSPYSNLLEVSHRLQLASEINDIIVQETTGQIDASKPRLVTLLKFLFWTQNELGKKKIQFPKMTDIVSGTVSEPKQ